MLAEKKKKEKRKPVVMSPIALIPDWSVVLTEFTSTVSFSFSFAFFFFDMFLNYPFCVLRFFFLSFSVSLLPIFSLFFSKNISGRSSIFFPFSLLVQYRPQSGHTHTHVLTLFPSILKNNNMSSTEVQLSERLPMLSSAEEVAHSNPVAPVAVPVETTTVVKK